MVVDVAGVVAAGVVAAGVVAAGVVVAAGAVLLYLDSSVIMVPSVIDKDAFSKL